MAAGATVTVACKIPNGIIMRVHEQHDFHETVPGGPPRPAKRAVEKARFNIAGPAAPFGMVPKTDVAGGYALTHNVPKDLWDAFKAQHSDSDMIVNKLLFAYEKPEATVSEAKNARKNLSGLEPIDTSTTTKEGKTVQVDPRWPRSLHPNLSTPATNDKKD